MSRYDATGDPRPPTPTGGLDGMFANTNIVLLILFAFCCRGIALILGIVGLAVCTHPLARRNALIVTIIDAVLFALGFVGYMAGMLGGPR